jgi:hypothetical protein
MAQRLTPSANSTYGFTISPKDGQSHENPQKLPNAASEVTRLSRKQMEKLLHSQPVMYGDTDRVYVPQKPVLKLRR